MYERTYLGTASQYQDLVSTFRTLKGRNKKKLKKEQEAMKMKEGGGGIPRQSVSKVNNNNGNTASSARRLLSLSVFLNLFVFFFFIISPLFLSRFTQHSQSLANEQRLGSRRAMALFGGITNQCDTLGINQLSLTHSSSAHMYASRVSSPEKRPMLVHHPI